MTVEPRIDRVAAGLDLIHLTPPTLDGFSDFIGVWLAAGPPACLVDVGPGSTADQLIRALENRGVSRLDYILLTHIHLDHAGAAGHIAARFPQAAIVCHENAIPHLADPSRLWEGSRKVLGAVADGYGPLVPIPAERLTPAHAFRDQGITAVLTPGHAPHHVSYVTPEVLFAGEACGVWYPLGGAEPYMRPATPPQFLKDIALASIEALLAHAPTRMAVGHLGLTADGVGLLQRHRAQLGFWEEWIAAHLAGFSAEQAPRRCLEGLLADDPLLSSLDRFPPSARKREEYFLLNSIRGFLGWHSKQHR
jgi:glyoxylase-like metal-dependent hydrolase (beta-lactamase superfamily II)